MAELNEATKTATLVVAAVIARSGPNGLELLACKRKTGESGAGTWEFPGGKVEVGESQKEALAREIREELGIAIDIHELLASGVHQYPLKLIELHAYHCSIKPQSPASKIILSDHDEYLWVDEIACSRLAWAAADLPLLLPIWTSLKSSL